MLTRSAWAGMIPHAGAMALIARVLRWDAEHLEAEADAPGVAHPLLRDGRLHALHACEYGAQAAAVHGALLARAGIAEPAPAGLLAALRGVRLQGQWVSLRQPLRIEVRRQSALPAAAQYRFLVQQGGAALAQGQALIAFGGVTP
jgi:predicted hotdog family 3-hydroxylacyl-ACP dehydratase